MYKVIFIAAYFTEEGCAVSQVVAAFETAQEANTAIQRYLAIVGHKAVRLW